MLKWLKRLGLLIVTILVILCVVVAALIFISDRDESIFARYQSTEAETIRHGWPGTPIDQHGRFMNHEFPFIPKLRGLLGWQLSPNQFRNEKRADTGLPSVESDLKFLSSESDGVMWLGHASFYIRANGVGLLIDPVFGEPSFIRRFQPVPSQLDSIRRVDLVLITHDHRDHLDEPSIRAIAERFPNAKFLAGSGSVELLASWVVNADRVVTANWFERFVTGIPEIDVTFVPVRHWSRRGLSDLNQRLWGGYVIETQKFSIYHGGDSGYGDHYKLVGETFPEIDLFLIGIGAYEPRWFMEPNHNNPQDVAKAFSDIGAKTLVPMHYGTFDLSDEPASWPLRDLKLELEKLGMIDRLQAIPINGSIELGNNSKLR